MVIEILCRAIRKPIYMRQIQIPANPKPVSKAMTAKKFLLAGVMVVLAIVAALARIAWINGSFGAAHVIAWAPAICFWI